jgi:hypothetical protein
MSNKLTRDSPLNSKPQFKMGNVITPVRRENFGLARWVHYTKTCKNLLWTKVCLVKVPRKAG